MTRAHAHAIYLAFASMIVVIGTFLALMGTRW